MGGYSRSSAKVDYPYRFLALNILFEAFRTIECYYNNIGTQEEKEAGKESINWIRNMSGNFRIIALAGGKPVDRFHQECIYKINLIKREANEKRRTEQKH